MTGYLYFYQQIASRSAIGSRFSFFTDTDALSIVDTCRNRYLDLLSACGKSGSTAIRAFVFDDLTGSSTVRTGLYVSVPYRTWTAGYMLPDRFHDICYRFPEKYPVLHRFRYIWYRYLSVSVPVLFRRRPSCSR